MSAGGTSAWPERDVDHQFSALEFQIAKLNVGPGDIVIVKCPEDWPREPYDVLGKLLRDAFDGLHVKWLLLPKSCDLAVLSYDGAKQLLPGAVK